jgi:hypothetical protein
MDIQQIITDTTLSPEAKVILVTGEIERQLRGYQDIEIALICEDVIFHRYHAPFIPHANELISCRLAVGKGHFATLWNVTQVEHGVGIDRLASVTVSVQAADTQTAMHWRRYPRENAE